jgi:hypothetical protein
MYVEPFFFVLTGLAAAFFASAAALSFLCGHRSALLDTIAAGASASLFLLPLPRTPIDIVLICGVAAIVELMVNLTARRVERSRRSRSWR